MNDQEDCEKERLTVTRADLAGAIYRQCPRLSRSEARRLCDEVFAEIVAGLDEGDSVRLRQFGSFIIRKKRPRVGRNPRSGVECEISARRSVSFRPSQVLVGVVNRASRGGSE